MRFLKKKWLLWAMEAWLKMGALLGSRAVETSVLYVSDCSNSVPVRGQYWVERARRLRSG